MHYPSSLSLFLFFVASAVASCVDAPLEPRQPSANTFHFTVQSYNVELFHSADEETIEAVGLGDADIISLQEVTPAWEETLRLRFADEYEYMLFKADPGSGGLAVLSRFPVTDLGFHEGPNGWHPAWHTGIETPAGPMQLLNVHLRSPLTGRSNSIDAALSTGEDHLLSIEQFTEACDGELLTLVVGDFNEGVDGAAVRSLESTGFRSVLPLYHPGQATWRYRALAGQFDKTLDHIMFDESLVPLDSWVIRAGNSDHLPVLAHFEVLPNL